MLFLVPTEEGVFRKDTFNNAQEAIKRLTTEEFTAARVYPDEDLALASLQAEFDAGLPPHLTRIDQSSPWQIRIRSTPSMKNRFDYASESLFDEAVQQIILSQKEVRLSEYYARDFCRRHPEFTQKTKDPRCVYYAPKLKKQRELRVHQKQQAIFASGQVPSCLLADLCSDFEAAMEKPTLKRHSYLVMPGVNRSGTYTSRGGWGRGGVSEYDASCACLRCLDTFADWTAAGLRFRYTAGRSYLHDNLLRVKPYLKGMIGATKDSATLPDQSPSRTQRVGLFLKKQLALSNRVWAASDRANKKAQEQAKKEDQEQEPALESQRTEVSQ